MAGREEGVERGKREAGGRGGASVAVGVEDDDGDGGMGGGGRKERWGPGK